MMDRPAFFLIILLFSIVVRGLARYSAGNIQEIVIEISALLAGIYFVKISENEKVFVEKVIIR